MNKPFRLLAVALFAAYAGIGYPLLSAIHETHHIAENNAFEKQHALICDGDGQTLDWRAEHQHFFDHSCDLCLANQVRRYSVSETLVAYDSFAASESGLVQCGPLPQRAFACFRLPPACGPPLA